MTRDPTPGQAGAAGAPARVLAVIVTFNPAAGLGAALADLRLQADEVLVIDNGSANQNEVADAARAAGCRLIAWPENLGVAAALSEGARAALAGGFDWLAMFDQDSRPPPRAIAELLALGARHPRARDIAVLAMAHRDRATGRDYHHGFDVIEQGAGWRSVRSTITSGSLAPVALFAKVGLFDDALFVDSVDHEFCLRCRRRGGLVIEATDVVLDHAKGDARVRRILGLSVPDSRHPPLRRYYIARNQLELVGRHILFDPLWCAQALALLACEVGLFLVFGPDRGAKLAATLEGARDAFAGRFGPRGSGRPRSPPAVPEGAGAGPQAARA